MPDAKIYTGGCHCGAVRFEVTGSLDKVISCNCSIREKRGLLLIFAAPDQFKLLSGGDKLADDVHNLGLYPSNADDFSAQIADLREGQLRNRVRRFQSARIRDFLDAVRPTGIPAQGRYPRQGAVIPRCR